MKWLTAREGSEQLDSPPSKRAVRHRYRYTWQLPVACTASIDSTPLSLSLFSPLHTLLTFHSFLVSSLSPTVGGEGASAPSILHRRTNGCEFFSFLSRTTQITLLTVESSLSSRRSFRKWYRFFFFIGRLIVGKTTSRSVMRLTFLNRGWKGKFLRGCHR